MFSINYFIEVQVVGILALLGILPLIILSSPSLRKRDGFFARLDSINDRTTKAVLMLVVAFSIGVAANRLFDDVLDYAGVDPGHQHKLQFTKWGEAPENQGKAKRLKIAEFALEERSPAIASWLDRHKLFIRVLRGAAISFILFFVSMGIYKVTRHYKEGIKPRYFARHFIATSILIIVFSLAYWLEAENYQQRVFDLYTQLPPAPALANK
ncbi:MAG TPA: hypothetical protein VGV59_05440 [Pyrinomonadaceae bacterium]|nr:hypothetical protein [Pyrinomonadaceae bacterium]